MAVPLRTFGVALIVFYLVGSRATKVGQALKSTLEEGHEEAGYRNASQVSTSCRSPLRRKVSNVLNPFSRAWQVVSNSFTAVIAACIWSLSYTPDAFLPSIFWKLTGWTSNPLPTSLYKSDAWCAVDPNTHGGQSRKLVFLALG